MTTVPAEIEGFLNTFVFQIRRNWCHTRGKHSYIEVLQFSIEGINKLDDEFTVGLHGTTHITEQHEPGFPDTFLAIGEQNAIFTPHRVATEHTSKIKY